MAIWWAAVLVEGSREPYGGLQVFDREDLLITLWDKSLMEESSWRQGVVQSCLKRVVDYTAGYKSNGEE